MQKSLEYHTETLESVAQCVESGRPDWLKRVSFQRRKELITFIDHPLAEVDEPFMIIFNRIVAALGARINLKLFELVLKIGINFTTPENDAYWFALFKCNDYGPVFDQPPICDLLLDEVLLLNGNSWKAACLMCILIQDYASAKGTTARVVAKNISSVYNLFQDVNDYACCCYMVELLSQLEAPEIVSQIFPKQLKAKITNGMYANDPHCVKFLTQFKHDQSVYHFKSFSIGDSVKCKASTCQLYPFYFVVLINHDQCAFPVQIEFNEISSVQQNGTMVRFRLNQKFKKTLLSVEIPSLSVAHLEFADFKTASNVKEGLEKVTKYAMTSTPRKISVVQEYIEVNSKLFEEADNTSSNKVFAAALPDNPRNDANAAIIPESTSGSLVQENSSIFASPVVNNTTKDTSASKHGIANASKKNPGPVTSVNPSALNRLDLVQEPVRAKPGLKTSYRREISKSTPGPTDIWDFESSDPDKTEYATSAIKSKVMKCLGSGTTKFKPQKATTRAKKTVIQERLENAANAPEVATKDIIVHSNESHLLMSESFSGLTSPLASKIERTGSNKRKLTEDYDNHNRDAPSITKKKHSHTSGDDDSYKPSQIMKPTTAVMKQRKGKMDQRKKVASTPLGSPRITRAHKAVLDRFKEDSESTRLTVKQGVRESLSDIFQPQRQETRTQKSISGKKLADQVLSSSKSSKTHAPVTDPKDQSSQLVSSSQALVIPPVHSNLAMSFSQMPNLTHDTLLLSEAYTNTLQRQIYESVNAFSNQMIKKIHIINDEMNKKVITDLADKYENLFNDLRKSFQTDVDEVCGFVSDVKGLLNLSEQQLLQYIKDKRFGQIGAITEPH